MPNIHFQMGYVLLSRSQSQGENLRHRLFHVSIHIKLFSISPSSFYRIFSNFYARPYAVCLSTVWKDLR